MHISRKLNQTGASAIVFTLVFILVLSLLSVGYATLARRDQRAALDKTLSAEAQFATEAGVNSVTKYIETVGLAAAQSSSANPDTECYNPTPGISGYNMPSFGSDGPKVTCIKWDMTPTSLDFTLNPYEPYSFNFTTSSANNWNKIEWGSSGSPSGSGSVYTVGANNKLPSVNEQAIPILKLAIANTANIYDAGWKPQIIYLVPSSSATSVPNNVTPVNLLKTCLGDPLPYINDFVDLGNGCIGNSQANINLADGLVYYVPCDTDKKTCSARIAGYHYDSGVAGAINLSYYIMAVGGQQSDVRFWSANGYDFSNPATLNKMTGVQAKVDVNVQAQDQSKRTVASIPLQKQTWQPWFAALADSLCKDIKVDGNNNQGKIDTATACPNNNNP